jgi:flavin reductase (DIM6/NTAB) family NADH-FMN oxidoreductase RutF
VKQFPNRGFSIGPFSLNCGMNIANFSSDQIKGWDRFYRGNFVNSLSGFKSASLIGTVNAQQIPNLAIFSNIVHIGSDPALIGFINRPREAAPHTLYNIESTGVYTINHIHHSFIAKAHQTSAKYREQENEFEKVGLTAEWDESTKAPFVLESRIKYALNLVEIIPIRYNNTYLVIGSITRVLVQEDIVGADGFLSIEKAGTIASLGLDSYYNADLLARFAYAKPGKPPEKIV